MEKARLPALQPLTVDLKVARVFSEIIHDIAAFLATGFSFIITICVMLFSSLPVLQRGLLFIPMVLGMAMPRIALALFLVALPVFGNRPGSSQAFGLMLVTCSLIFGLTLSRFLPSEERFYNTRLPHSALHLLLSFYVLVSFLSLSSLPINEFIYYIASQLPSLVAPNYK